jgi:pimeloyl-ACP methyl ester carboxylesterase
MGFDQSNSPIEAPTLTSMPSLDRIFRMTHPTASKTFLAAALALAAATCVPALAAGKAAAPTAAAAAMGDTTVVLVHGAFADGSSWDKVIPLLQAKGLKVVAVQNPLTSLADDVAAAQRAIDAATGKVVLVGHSWGGTVITQAGAGDKVKALVYVAALAPSEGQSSADVGKDYPPTTGIQKVKADAAGFLSMSPEDIATEFAQDLPRATTRVMAVTQGPIQGKAFAEPVTVVAWKNKPNYYLVAAKDRMIQPALQQALAKTLNATTVTLPTGHVPMQSQPRAVADLIVKAAQAK